MGNCIATDVDAKSSSVKAAWLAYKRIRASYELKLPLIMDEDELDYLIDGLQSSPLQKRPKNLQLVVGQQMDAGCSSTTEVLSACFRRSKVFQPDEEEKEEGSTGKLNRFCELLGDRLESLELVGHMPARSFYSLLDAVGTHAGNLKVLRFMEMDLRGYETGQKMHDCLTLPTMSQIHSIHLHYCAIDEAMLTIFADALVQLRELHSFDIAKCGMNQDMFYALSRRLENHKNSSPFASSLELDLHANCSKSLGPVNV